MLGSLAHIYLSFMPDSNAQSTRRWDFDAPALTWMSSRPRTIVILTFDLIRSTVGASEYSPIILSKLFKPFTRYHGNKIWPGKRTNEQTGQQAFTDTNQMPDGKRVAVSKTVQMNKQQWDQQIMSTKITDNLLKIIVF